MKSLPVDLPELIEALDQPRRAPVRTFVDRQTGAIEHVPLAVEVEGVFDDIFAAPERWVEVQPLTPPARDRLRRRFLEVVTDPQVRLRLADALALPPPAANGGPPVPRPRDFASVLRELPGLLDAWLRFRERELETTARAWLSAIGILPPDAGPGPPS